MREALTAFSKKATDGLVLFGYSATAKFVAKLATENFNIKALFLIDPVDGTPPFTSKKNFPVFLTEESHINAPTWIVKSEFGTTPWALGKPCVPHEHGSEFFASHTDLSMLKFIHIAGSSHIDFLHPPISQMLKMPCKPGSANPESTRTTTLQLFQEAVNLAMVP
jgi:hypothetical protein